MFEQARARIGKHDAAAVALEQILPQFHLQLADLAAQCRLYHRKECGGAGEAAEFRDMPEVFELFQVHGASRYVFLL